MVRVGAWLSHEFDLEILSCGRAGNAPQHSCKLELCGRHLLFDLTVDGSWLFTSVALLDRADPPESLLSVADGADGWETTRKLVAALEYNEIRSLTRPLEIGNGPDGFVIA